MTDFARRLTWPGEDRPDDWVFICRGKDVGRCYRSRFGMTVADRWQWTIYGRSERGYANSLEAAQAEFKANYLATFSACGLCRLDL
jgi:hypothetical protein